MMRFPISSLAVRKNSGTGVLYICSVLGKHVGIELGGSWHVPHLSQFVQHLHTLLVELALKDEFAIILPPVQQSSVFHPSFSWQMLVFFHVGLEELIIPKPVLASLSCNHI